MTKREFVAELMQKYPNVTGVSFGLKNTGGVTTREESIQFNVLEKKNLKDIPKEERIPSSIEFDGVTYKTDIETTQYSFLDNSVFPQGARQNGQAVTVTADSNFSIGDTQAVFSGVSSTTFDLVNNSLTMLWGAPRNAVGFTSSFGAKNFITAITWEDEANEVARVTVASPATQGIGSGNTTQLTFVGGTGNTSGTHLFAPGIGQSGDVNEQTGTIVGGAGMSNWTSNPNSIGTLGFVALDEFTDALVGVTNAHVAGPVDFGGMILEEDTYALGDALPNTAVGDTFQWPLSSNTTVANSKGFVWRVNQCINTTTDFNEPRNTVDGACLFLKNGVTDANSYKMFNSDVIPAYPEWCTEDELDNLMVNGNDLFSVGTRTGIKGSDVDYVSGIKLKAINSNQATLLGTPDADNSGSILMTDMVSFAAFNSNDPKYGDGAIGSDESAGLDYGPAIPGASQGGDSGSAVFADINGTWKLAGLLFAGSYSNNRGSFCKITNVARQLNIKRWDGTNDRAVPLTGTIDRVIIGGQLTDPTVVINGTTYFRAGYTNTTADTHNPNP